MDLRRDFNSSRPCLSMESDDDDELERAIQLSLQTEQDRGSIRRTDVVDLTEDDDVWPGFEDLEEMEIWKAIAVSMGEGPTSILFKSNY